MSSLIQAAALLQATLAPELGARVAYIEPHWGSVLLVHVHTHDDALAVRAALPRRYMDRWAVLVKADALPPPPLPPPKEPEDPITRFRRLVDALPEHERTKVVALSRAHGIVVHAAEEDWPALRAVLPAKFGCNCRCIPEVRFVKC